MSLYILVKENLKNKKSTFIGLTILMMIISFILITVISVNKNIDESMYYAHKYIDSGSVFAWIKPTADFDSLIDQVESLSNVKKVKVFDSVEVNLDVNNEDHNKNVQLVEYSSVYRVYNDSYNGYKKSKPLSTGEIYLPVTYKYNYNVNLNDIVHVKVKNEIIDYKVVGFIEEPVAGSSMMGIKNALISKKDIEMLQNKYDDNCFENCVYPFHYIHIYQNDKQDNEDFSRKINMETGIIDAANFSLTKSESIYYHTVMNSIISGFLYSFAFILSVVAIIVISYSLNNSIEMEFKSIGILKSVGISTTKIRLSLIIEYILICIIGLIIGGFLALLGIHYLGSLLVMITGVLPKYNINFDSIILCVLLLLFILLFIIIKTIKVSKISPLSAIMVEEKRISNSHLKNKLSSKLLNIKLAIRQLFSNTSKYISIIFISCILVFVMSLISSLNDELQSNNIIDKLGLVPYDMYVEYDGDYQDVDDIIKRYSDIEYKYYYNGSYFTVDGYQYYGLITSDFDPITSITEGRKPENENEIIVTKLIADKIKKQIGDTVTVSYKNQKRDYKIVGYFQTINDVGKCFMMSIDAVRLINPDISYKEDVYKLSNKEKVDKIEEDLTNELENVYIENLVNDSDFVMIKTIFKILNFSTYLISVIFILITIILISHRMLLYEEKTIGIYKSLGFQSGKLRMQFSFRFLFVSLVGSIIGVILSIFLNNTVLNLLLKGIGITKYDSSITILGCLIPILLVNTCFLLFPYLISHKINKVSINTLIIE